MDLGRFVAELKRRRVVRVAVAYAASLFLVLQVADLVVPAVGLSDVWMTGILVAGGLGFPIALALAWALQWTPGGPERDRSAALGDVPERSGGLATLRTALLLGTAILVVGVSIWWARGTGDGPGTASIRSLAVLPLQNQMGDDAQLHFVDGMHDILIGELSRIDSLSVISQRSVMRFRGSEMSMAAIARELAVDALIEGSVFRQGDSVRVTARLIRPEPESDLWQNRYEGRLSQAMSLQSRVARAIADEIQLALSDVTAKHLARTEDIDPEAMDAYLLGRQLWKSRNQSQMVRAIDHLRRAVELDSTFALGWAGLADGYSLAIGYGALDIPRDSATLLARRAVDRAIHLDPSLMEAVAARGALHLYALQDFSTAEAELARVIELAPSYAQGHNWLADALGAMGRVEEALTHYERAVQLDPLSTLMYRDYARGLAQVGNCEEAIVAARRSLELDPSHFYAADQIARCQFMLGRDEAAVETTLNHQGGTLRDRQRLRQAWQEGGSEGFLMEEARQMEQILHILAAIRYAEAGAKDAAFGEIDLAIADREPLLIALRANPAFDVLHDDPRWHVALDRLDSLAAGASSSP